MIFQICVWALWVSLEFYVRHARALLMLVSTHIKCTLSILIFRLPMHPSVRFLKSFQILNAHVKLRQFWRLGIGVVDLEEARLRYIPLMILIAYLCWPRSQGNVPAGSRRLLVSVKGLCICIFGLEMSWLIEGRVQEDRWEPWMARRAKGARAHFPLGAGRELPTHRCSAHLLALPTCWLFLRACSGPTE